MSALDLDALERRARKGIVLNPDETLALITRLRAAEGALRAIARGDARDVLLPQEGDRPLMEGARDYFSGIVEANRKLKEMWPDYDDSDVLALAVARAMLITLNAERDATMRAAEARTAWQPIETAPLDTWVWVAAKPHSGVMEGRLEAGWWVVSDGNTFAQEPTHWAHIQRPPRLPWLAPLPAAPEAP